MTSSREDRDVAEGYELGVNAYVVKPVDFPSFVESVKDLGVFWALVNHPPVGSVSRSV
jgi:CheY-like chemotaxis protein